MNPYLYSVRLPLFSNVDEVGDFLSYEQLEQQTFTIPISYTLLDALHHLTPRNSGAKHVEKLLDEILKSPSFFFPDVPLSFERQGIFAFVPDDNLEHVINWKSIVLQAHISFLTQIGWENISKHRQPSAASIKEPGEQTRVHFGSRQDVGSRSSRYVTGSISVRSQNKCVASFNDKLAIGSMTTPSFNEIQYTIAPQIERDTHEEKDEAEFNLDLNQLFDFQLQGSFENPLFKGIILAISSRGMLDRSLGILMCEQLKDEISAAGFQIGRVVDATAAFEEYYASLLRSLLPVEDENEIRDWIGNDKIEPILSKFDQLYPFHCVPHAYYFLKQILAPLCYHEISNIAQRATKQLMTLFNYHDWELHSTQVVTAENQIEFEQSSEHVIVICGPSSYGNNFSTLVGNKTTFVPAASGFYDFCYARVSVIGELEIDQSMPCGRYVVLPSGARKEIIHELPAFDDKSTIKFDDLAAHLETLSNAGATAVHVTGVIERNFLHDLTSVTDHAVFSKECGGLEAFKQFCDRAKQFGLRVLIDFIPLVCLKNSSKKYSQYGTLTADSRGRLITADIPETEMMLLNYRSLQFWDLLAEEILTILDSCGISGFYLGSIEHWDTVFPRDLTELMRSDPDDNLHYTTNNIIEGTIISTSSNESCGLAARKAEYCPHMYHIMRKIWSKKPDAFVWVQCEHPELEPFVIKSGLIPANYNFRNVMQCSIEYSVHNDNVDYVNANENLIKLYDERKKRNPEGSLLICPFGALMDGPFNLPMEGLSLAIDMLFYLTDVPLISGCLDTAMFYANAYSTIKQVWDKNSKRPEKWWPPRQRFTDLLTNRASTRMKADWALGGDVQILPVSYDSHPMRAILSVSRTCPKSKRCCLICTSFYMYNLIYEVSVRDLAIFNDRPADSVVEVKPILGAGGQTTYYSINEVKGNGSALFLELGKFETCVYEITLIQPPIPPNIGRTLMEHVYVRLQRAIRYDSRTVLSNNNIFNQILQAVEGTPSDSLLNSIVSALPNNSEAAANLREAFFYATRNKKDGQNNLVEITDEDVIEKREHRAIELLHHFEQSKTQYIAEIGKAAIESNDLGPICFVAPELGPFSKVGGLSTMVWELAKELVNLGLDIHVISPYYNVSPKGETDYLKKYGIEYKQTIDVYCPDQIKIGIHYGVVDGVKCWFLHHYSFFAAPYQTGSTSFRLQLLVVMAKASLELLCQVRIIPKLIVSNDWMTGLVPAMGRKQFGSVFDSTKFLHIFHNLGVGYAGKIWPNNGDTGSLRYIHQLPDELIVDNFDHSFDPSLSSLLCSDQWATVSKKYRQELLEGSPYNWLLCRYPKPFAYSNGIRFQERLDALKKLNLTHEEAKRVVQQKYFGYVDDSKCLFVFVGRIVEQKGVYLIIDSFEELNRQFNGQLQFIVGGQAAPDDRAYGLPCTQRMWDLKNRYPKQFWADPSQFFSDGLLACQAADYTLIPSLFEPSGIVQQEAFASGCPVIAFRTGGLADTVFEFDREKHTGNGFVFLSHHHHDFIMAVQRAYDVFQDKPLYEILRKQAFASTLSTETVAIAWSREFARLFMKIFERKYPIDNPNDKITTSQTPNTPTATQPSVTNQ